MDRTSPSPQPQHHTLYMDIPWDRTAQAACYQCATSCGAAHLIWIALPHLAGYLALCRACYDGCWGDAERLVAVVPPCPGRLLYP